MWIILGILALPLVEIALFVVRRCHWAVGYPSLGAVSGVFCERSGRAAGAFG
jgi:hypothetical protein